MMEYLILSALTGLSVGFASVMFSRTRSIKPRAMNVLAALCGSLLLGFIGHILKLSVPIPAVALVGALTGIMLLVIFRKPDSEHRSYYL